MEVASITIAQALLLGFFWWFKTNYYGQTFTCFISNSCLTAALFVGIVLGDIPNAMIIGASVQLIYLGILGPGGNLPQDPVLATLVSTAIVLKSGMPVETAFAIAVPVGILGAQILCGKREYTWNISCRTALSIPCTYPYYSNTSGSSCILWSSTY